MSNYRRNNHGDSHREQPRPLDIGDVMKGMKVIGADININDDRVSVPRDDYDTLLYSAALVDILERLYKASGKYAVADLLVNLFGDNDDEKEDK